MLLFVGFLSGSLYSQNIHEETSKMVIQELQSYPGNAASYFDPQIPALEDKLNLIANAFQDLQDPTVANAIIKKDGKEIYSYAFSEGGEFQFKVELIYDLENYDDLVDWVEFSNTNNNFGNAPPPISEDSQF